MVTQNLYEPDSVVATLLHAIQTGNNLLAIQTSKELMSSGDAGLVFRALTFAWWLTDPCNVREYEQHEAFVKGNPKEFLFSLFTDRQVDLPVPLESPSAPPPKIAAAQTAQPTQWTNYPKGWTPHQAGRLWHAVQFALSRGHHSHAMHLVRPLLIHNRLSVLSLLKALDVDIVLTDVLAITTYLPLAERILAHIFAATVSQSEHLDNSRWEILWMQSTGRCFYVCPEAMALWGVRSTPVDCLIGCPILVTNSRASAFWKDRVKKYGCTVNGDMLVFPDDDACESFYNNFPIDIPDEWSLKERTKSHGIIVPASVIPNPWVVPFLQLWV